ncbi:sensor histidine kinase [Caulobacter sp. UNC279MFTsu5.1]|uniref:sensor histidine kinase n=1 Tax=Caulobacter sp. UNC279MFTsu5.1 TaxID=1502775 RepID=UPI0008E1D259|nr:HWE histidine kinase domain-containing protein [Caulobacter sp. UNC279MFTsu5.1]SFK49491.1 PAS domain S-box-containing protein [Caulobacter sp. UNC279MFTsu5.1]
MNESEQTSATPARPPIETDSAPGDPLAESPLAAAARSVSPSVTTALKHAPMGIAIFDDQMRYLAASRQYLTDQGMPPDMPLLGRRHYDVFPEIPQFWRDKHAQVLAEGVELREDEGDRYVDGAGRVHWVRWSMAPWRTDDGRIGGLVLYTEMVTAAMEARQRLQAAEARYRAVFDQAAMGVARVSGSGRFLEVNDKFCAITRRDRETLLASTFMDIAPGEDNVATVVTKGLALLAGEIDTYALERRVEGRDGPVWVHVTASRVDPGDGRPYLVVIISDITERKLVEAEQQHYQDQLRLLINELNHRVKNTLATVQSMASQTLKTEADPVVAFEKFESRLLGLSQVHDVLTRESWHGAGLRDVAERALAPFTSPEGPERLVIDGPPVWLAPGGALTMALIFHELATNALKYGALSNGQGRVVLSWAYDAASRDLALTWTETGGPPTAPPTRRGFGSRLIERSLRGELKGAASMDYRPEGLVCTMRATLSDPVEGGSPLRAG